jgi:hypothetical protein
VSNNGSDLTVEINPQQRLVRLTLRPLLAVTPVVIDVPFAIWKSCAAAIIAGEAQTEMQQLHQLQQQPRVARP